MKTRHIVGSVLLVCAGAAMAGPQCTDAPVSEWIPQAEMRQQLINQGYIIDRFLVTDGNCYEIYGADRKGVKVEIYFNPVSGEPVKERRND